MNEFKTMKFIREMRDKIYKETKDKTNEEIRRYYTEKASWINSYLVKSKSNTVKSKKQP